MLSINDLISLYVDNGENFDILEFTKVVGQNFGGTELQKLEPVLDKIISTKELVDKNYQIIIDFVNELKTCKTRKLQAELISNFCLSNLAKKSIIFDLLDEEQVDTNKLRKLIYQMLLKDGLP